MGLVGIYHVPLPAISLPFHLFILLCLGWPFCILAVCGSSIVWRFLAVWGAVGQVACQGFLFRESCVSVLVGGAGFLLSGVK